MGFNFDLWFKGRNGSAPHLPTIVVARFIRHRLTRQRLVVAASIWPLCMQAGRPITCRQCTRRPQASISRRSRSARILFTQAADKCPRASIRRMRSIPRRIFTIEARQLTKFKEDLKEKLEKK